MIIPVRVERRHHNRGDGSEFVLTKYVAMEFPSKTNWCCHQMQDYFIACYYRDLVFDEDEGTYCLHTSYYDDRKPHRVVHCPFCGEAIEYTTVDVGEYYLKETTTREWVRTNDENSSD
jgi:hypothetical protein